MEKPSFHFLNKYFSFYLLDEYFSVNLTVCSFISIKFYRCSYLNQVTRADVQEPTGAINNRRIPDARTSDLNSDFRFAIRVRRVTR